MIDINNIEEIVDLTGPLKRVALFNDISGFGKASITVELPILACANIEAACIPTAILSTHTGEFKNFTFRDLTEDLDYFLNHWDEIGVVFNAIFSGYLASPDQIKYLLDFINNQKEKNPECLIYIDPVMGDNGKLYNGYKESLVAENKKLVKKADIILPNLTESFLLLGKPFVSGPYEKELIKSIGNELQNLGPKKIIITGIELGNEKIGIAIFDENKFELLEVPKVPGKFHGTGDVFASLTLGAYLNNFSLIEAVKIASALTYIAARRTEARNTPRREGIDFEGILPLYIEELAKQPE